MTVAFPLSDLSICIDGSLRRLWMAACSSLVILGFGGLAVESACEIWSRTWSAVTLLRTRRLGSICWMTSEKGILFGAYHMVLPKAFNCEYSLTMETYREHLLGGMYSHATSYLHQ